MCLRGFAPWHKSLIAAVLSCIAIWVGAAFAEEATVNTVLGGLHRPCGIAVRTGGTADRFEVFVAESGAGRVVRWSIRAPQDVDAVVTGFKTNTAAEPSQQTGPRVLWFLDPGLLLVGTTRDDDGDLVRAYELPDEDQPLAANAARESSSSRSEQDGATCFAVARTRANENVPDLLILAIRGADGHARLRKARLQAGVVGALTPLAANDAADDAAASPNAVAITGSGRILVADSGGRLTFYNPIDGTVELAMPTDLKQIVDLAYSPTTGCLYAADFGGGIYRIDDASEPGHPACQAVKIADVSRPTALAFAPDGNLYVTTFGSKDDDGTLTTIAGDL